MVNPLDVNIEDYKRMKKLSINKIKPCLIIRSPRETSFIKENFDRLNFIDKYFFKYFTITEVISAINEFVSKNKDKYTHFIICSDDVTPTPYDFKLLIEDIQKYDVPIITGVCNFCHIHFGRGAYYATCPICDENEEHEFVSATFEPCRTYMGNNDDGKHIIGPPCHETFGSVCRESYNFITERWRRKNQVIKSVFFHGMALTAFRADSFEMFDGLKPYSKRVGLLFDDMRLGIDCYLNNIPQFCDFRIYIRHWGGSTYKEKIIGMSKVIFEPAVRPLGDVLSASKFQTELEPILICSPFCNEEHSIPQYMAALENLYYPKELIDVIWFENDSSDMTWNLLKKYYDEFLLKGYNSITLLRKKPDKPLPKVKQEDFGKLIRYAKCALYEENREHLWTANNNVLFYTEFFSRIKKYHKYIVIFMADCVPEWDALMRCLDVFNKYHDAGWVGGVIHGRKPMLDLLGSPLFFNRYLKFGGFIKRCSTPSLYNPEDIELLEMIRQGKTIVECGMTAHFWMMKAHLVKNFVPSLYKVEVVISFIDNQLWSKGYKVYCDLEMFLKHISLDGKIYRTSLRDYFKISTDKTVKIDNIETFKQLINEIKTEEERSIVIVKEKAPEKVIIEVIQNPVVVDERKVYKEFIKSVFPLVIPNRPSETGKVFDRIQNEIINAETWDKLYGKWVEFINGDED